MIVTSKTPRLDLHNEIGDMVEVLTNEFIKDNILLKNEVIVIIHGISGKVIKKRLYEVLKENKNVKSFKVNNWNIGETIIELKI